MAVSRMRFFASAQHKHHLRADAGCHRHPIPTCGVKAPLAAYPVAGGAVKSRIPAGCDDLHLLRNALGININAQPHPALHPAAAEGCRVGRWGRAAVAGGYILGGSRSGSSWCCGGSGGGGGSRYSQLLRQFQGKQGFCLHGHIPVPINGGKSFRNRGRADQRRQVGKHGGWLRKHKTRSRGRSGGNSRWLSYLYTDACKIHRLPCGAQACRSRAEKSPCRQGREKGEKRPTATPGAPLALQTEGKGSRACVVGERAHGATGAAAAASSTQ